MTELPSDEQDPIQKALTMPVESLAKQAADETPEKSLEVPPGDLQELTKLAAQYRENIRVMERDLKAAQESYGKAADTILRTLDLMDIDSVRAHGFLFFKERKTSVTTPKTPEEKEQLFEFLQQRGIFLEMASVNSQTLNSLYKSLAEEAAEKGVLDFRMPGVGEPTEYISLKMRKG